MEKCSSIPPTFVGFFLSHWKYPCAEPTGSDIAITLFTIAKTTITLKWCDSNPPTVTLWQKKVLEHFVLNNLVFFFYYIIW